tara:strand:+ start:5411 stop:5749 length:339 start_codon:yes stop_codon:yes gene_type:complete
MSLILAIIMFNATSFIIYGLSSFFSKRMRKEYVRWGYNKERKMIGFFQILGGIGLIIGLYIPKFLYVSSFMLSIMMLLAIVVRIKIKDGIIEMLPAITYLFLSLIIFFNNQT